MDKFVCRDCGDSFTVEVPRWRCECGGLLDLDFKPSLNIETLSSQPHSLWRYRDALPVPVESELTLGEGFTPIIPVEIGSREVLIKQEHLFPTGSYKDRGAAVMMSMANHLGIRSVVEDSSGNAGCSVAAYSAKAGIECRIFVPAKNSPGKMGQIELYGAELVRIPGSREDTAQACMDAAGDTFYASHVYNPYFFHGTKTFAYEIAEQLGWRAPDSVVLPVGNGTLLLGAYIGFAELVSLGLVSGMPRIVGIQATPCAPLYAGFQSHLRLPGPIQPSRTLAEGIAIADPKRGAQILESIRKTDGLILQVGDDEILRSFHEMGRQGFCIEPTSSATIAGVRRYLNLCDPDEVVVSLFSGHGLKIGDKLHEMAVGPSAL